MADVPPKDKHYVEKCVPERDISCPVGRSSRFYQLEGRAAEIYTPSVLKGIGDPKESRECRTILGIHGRPRVQIRCNSTNKNKAIASKMPVTAH